MSVPISICELLIEWSDDVYFPGLKDMPGVKRGDLRSPITRGQSSTSFFRNYIKGILNEKEIITLVLDRVEQLLKQAPDNSSHIIKRAVERQEADCTASKDLTAMPPAPDTGSHENYVRDLLIPFGKIDFFTGIDAAVLDETSRQHVKDLNNLRRRSCYHNDSSYEWIIAGKFGRVVQALSNNQLPGHNPIEIVRIIRNQARCFAWRVARQRVSFLRRLATKPYDRVFNTFVSWPTWTHSCFVTMIGPASLLGRLMEESQPPDAQKLIAEDVLAWLVSNDFVPNAVDGKVLLALARKILAALQKRHPADISTISELLRQDNIKNAAKISRLRPGHFKHRGLSKVTFPEVKLGITTSEGAAFVAEELCKIFNSINEILDPLLSPPATKYGQRRSSQEYKAYLTTLLRGVIDADKDAVQIGLPPKSRRAKKEGAKVEQTPVTDSHGSVRSIRKLQKKLECPLTLQRLKSVLGISGDMWFGVES